MIIALNVPFIGTIRRYYFYGSSKLWITAGLALWMEAGSIPVYMADFRAQ